MGVDGSSFVQSLIPSFIPSARVTAVVIVVEDKTKTAESPVLLTFWNASLAGPTITPTPSTTSRGMAMASPPFKSPGPHPYPRLLLLLLLCI